MPVKATGPSVSRPSLLPCFSGPYFQLCATDEGSELCCNAPWLSLGQEGTASCGQATGQKGRERSNHCPHSTVSTRQGPFEFTFESKCCISKHDALIKPSTPLIKTEYWCFACGGQGNLDKGQVHQCSLPPSPPATGFQQNYPLRQDSSTRQLQTQPNLDGWFFLQVLQMQSKPLSASFT